MACPNQLLSHERNNGNQDSAEDNTLFADAAGHLFIQEVGQKGQNKTCQGGDEALFSQQEDGSTANSRTDESADETFTELFFGNLLGGDGDRLLLDGPCRDGSAAGSAERSTFLDLRTAVGTDHKETSSSVKKLHIHDTRRSGKCQ